MSTTNEEIADTIDRYMHESVKESCARLGFSSGLEKEEIDKLEAITLFILDAAMANIVSNCYHLGIPAERGAVVFIESVARWNRKIDEGADKRRRGGVN